MARHHELRFETGLRVISVIHTPLATWDKRKYAACQYFPKGTDISRFSAEELDAVAALECATEKGPWLENSCGGFTKSLTARPNPCCDDSLSPVSALVGVVESPTRTSLPQCHVERLERFSAQMASPSTRPQRAD